MKNANKTTIENKSFEKERSLYGLSNTIINNCRFEGKEDGESPLKECKNIVVNNSHISLRYPLWHDTNFTLTNITMDDGCRAALWYDKNGVLYNVDSSGIKALRECKNITIYNCKFKSDEFGWKCKKINLASSSFIGSYFLFGCENVTLDGVTLDGKYSFQYNKRLKISNCNFKTKDAFWHVNGAYIENSVIEGEYIAWYSNNLTFVNCTFKGTQPFCYCKKLKLINCEFIDADLAFENSDVKATIKGKMISIKNPRKGKIEVEYLENYIKEDNIRPIKAKIITKNK